MRECLKNPMPDYVSSGITDPISDYREVQECLTIQLMLTGDIGAALKNCAVIQSICGDQTFVNCMISAAGSIGLEGDGMDEVLKQCWPS